MMTLTCMLTTGAVATSLAVLTGPLMEDDDQTHTHAVTQYRTVSDGDDRTIEIRIENGEKQILVNGEEVDSDALEIGDGGRMILRMPDGNVTIIGEVGQPGMLRWRMPDSFVFDGANNVQFGTEMPFVTTGGGEARVVIGIHMDEPGEALVHHLQIDPAKVTMISNVIEGLGADRAGLHTYDVIVGVEGRDSATVDDLRAAIGEREAGDEIELHVIHAGRKRAFTVELEEIEDGLQTWTGEFDFDDMTFPEGFDPEGDVFFAPEIENFRGRVIRPGEAGEWFRVQRGDDGNVSWAERGEQQDDDEGGDDLDDRIDRLSDRIAELEGMLERLIEVTERRDR